MNKRINQAGIDLIKRFEGFSSHAYKDPVGIPTIGYGFTKGVQMGDSITEEQAEARLKVELISREKVINEMVHADINDNQFSALVCLVYNIGAGAFIGSTLLKYLNSGAGKMACANEFLRWDKAKGKTLRGLSRRREAERELFLT